MYGLNTTVIRYFNSYGPGEFPGKYRNVIPNFFHKAMKGEPLLITGTGNETRDFNYVGNAVEGTMLAFTKNNGIGQVFNIGYGDEIKIIELAKKINKITKNEAGIIYQEKRNWDNVLRRCASIDKARKMLGYQPNVELDEGLKHKYEWMQSMAHAGLLQ
jgi:nucleoside-diphosphate-sugar epimerase